MACCFSQREHAVRTLLEQANARADADRIEARATLERERTEVDRLRSELTTTRARAERLATISDELRTQLVQSQITQGRISLPSWQEKR